MLKKNYQLLLRRYWLFGANWINDQPIHYRVMGWCVVAFIVYLLWYFILYGPVSKEKSLLNKNEKSLNSEIIKLKEKSTAIIVEANKPPDKKLQTRRDKLLAENEILTKQLSVLDQDMIPPEKIADVLREILGKESLLQLIQLRSLPTKSLFSEHLSSSKGQEQLLSQGMTLELKGDYFHTLDYLKRVEQLKWRIFWDRLQYKVLEYPEAEIIIQVHTLSRK